MRPRGGERRDPLEGQPDCPVRDVVVQRAERARAHQAEAVRLSKQDAADHNWREPHAAWRVSCLLYILQDQDEDVKGAEGVRALDLEQGLGEVQAHGRAQAPV